MNNLSTNEHLRSEENLIDLRSILYDLYEHKHIIIIVSIIMFALGLVYASRQVPQYQTNVLIQVQNQPQGMGTFGNFSQQFIGFNRQNLADTQSALIRSRFILSPVVELLGLDISAEPHRLPIIGNFFHNDNSHIRVSKLAVPAEYINKNLTLISEQADHFSLYNDKKELLLQGEVNKLVTSKDLTLQILVDSIDANPGEKFSVIKYSTTRITNNLAPRLIITDLGASLKGDSKRTDVLQISLIDTNPTRLIKILNAIAEIAQANDNKRKSREAAKTLQFLNQQLPLVKDSLEKAETNLNHYRATSGKIDIEQQTKYLLDQLSDLDKQINELQMSKSDSLQINTPQHPFVIALDRKLKQLEDQRNRLLFNLKMLPESDQIAVNMLRDVTVKKDLYLILLNRIQELQVIKASTVSDLRILSLAPVPDAPIPVKTSVISLGSLLFGVILASGFIIARKAFYQGVDNPHWIERQLNIHNVAIIPFSNQQALNIKHAKDKSMTTLPLLARDKPRDLSIEAMRSLRTSLQVMLFNASNNIISIIGISPNVGKSFISANFAFLLADAGKRVLLIDGDVRRGHLHDYFQIKRVPGLIEVMNDSISIDEVLNETFQKNLTFLPVGTYPKNPSELLMSDKFKDLMKTLSSRFDLVLIDTAPVLAVTDGALIGALSGTNFIIIGSRVHRPDEIEMGVRRLTSAGVQIHGSIFNHLKKGSMVSSYYRYNYYYDYNPDQVTAK